MLTTGFTELVGCSMPIQQAGTGCGIATPRLAAAVATAGGLGMVSVYGQGYTPELIEQVLDRARDQTAGALGANFLLAGSILGWRASGQRLRRARFRSSTFSGATPIQP